MTLLPGGDSSIELNSPLMLWGNFKRRSHRVLLLEGYATAAFAFHGVNHPWPRFTSEGFRKTRVPRKVYGDIKDFYDMARKYDRFKRGEKEPTTQQYLVVSSRNIIIKVHFSS